MEQYILRFYCAVVIALSTCTTTFAQFYDNDDEIHFYQCTLLNGKVNEASTRNNSWVFNFDGMKATNFGYHTTQGIKNVLKENLNYFEGQVYGATYNVKYREDLSSSSWTVYSRYNSGLYGMSSWTSYWYFSKDRKEMIYKESSSHNEWTYKLVDKSFYIEEGRSRSNMKEGKIYE